MNAYSGIAPYYDGLNPYCPYGEYAGFIENCKKRYGSADGNSYIDFACGTGSMSVLMAQKGYKVTAFDISDEELTVADKKARDMGLSVTYLKSDMRTFSGSRGYTFGACCMDGVNYLQKKNDIAMFFNCAYNCLEDGGVFVFDVNTKYRFENLYAQRDYILESEKALLAWQNDYDPAKRRCRFYLSLFAADSNGTYRRIDETHTEYCHSDRTLKAAAKDAGFELCGIFGGTGFEEYTDTSEKAYYVLRKTAKR